MALRHRLSPGWLLSRCEATLGRCARAVKHRPGRGRTRVQGPAAGEICANRFQLPFRVESSGVRPEDSPPVGARFKRGVRPDLGSGRYGSHESKGFRY